MDLVRDVLDKQLLDRERKKMNKVDGIILEIGTDQPPRLAYLEVSGLTLAQRLHPRLGRWVAAWRGKKNVTQNEVFRIPWSQVRDVGVDIEVDVDAEQTPVLAWERWLQQKIISRIPGSG